MKRFLALCIVIGFSLFFLQMPSYGFSINISPPSIHLTVAAGWTDSSTITVENKSEDPIDMRAYVEDWVYDDAGGKKFHPPGSTPLSCAKWINLFPQKFHLEAQGKLGVQYTISVPEDAEGGHYAVIFFESIVGDAEAEGNVMVRFAGRIGSIIYQETEGKTDRRGSIVSFSCGRPDQNKPLKIKVAIKNEGNAHISATGVMNIIDAEGNIFGRKELGPINTLPGDTAEYETEWLGALDEGAYDVIATFDAGVDIPLVAETAITVASGAEIEKIEVDTSAEQAVFDVIIHNTGNRNLSISGKLEILNETGGVVDSISLKKTLIAPNGTKGLKAEPEAALAPGGYKAKATVLLGDKELIKEEIFSVR